MTTRSCGTTESGAELETKCSREATHESTAVCECGHLKTTDICDAHAKSTISRLALGDLGRMVCGLCWRDKSNPHPCPIQPTLTLIK